MIKLSVILPSWKDPLLIKTINSLLENSELGDQLEIIAVLDGYWPTFELRQDPRVRYVHLGKNRGIRGAINAGVEVSRGEFIMKNGEHQTCGKGYDRILTETCESNWIVTPRRYFLDSVKWEVTDTPFVDYYKLKIQNVGNEISKFVGVEWSRPERADIMIDETMAMQGSCWVMPRKWWDEAIEELQVEGYGQHFQDFHEIVFKTWKAGGKLMVNKNTWFAHEHVNFSATPKVELPENSNKPDECYAYALSVWGDYYLNEIKPKWQI